MFIPKITMTVSFSSVSGSDTVSAGSVASEAEEAEVEAESEVSFEVPPELPHPERRPAPIVPINKAAMSFFFILYPPFLAELRSNFCL